ncbi:MAG: AAA family ATPase [Desulfobacteraceae bacterium]|jgi:general secretion pathway protein A
MYKNFFGFKERPFKLVPNPAYLYLSRGHEEALAHLTYAIRQGDGFVEITGEVGTGKTTLCRAFLENLGEEGLEAAYIFNPKLDAIQLLRAINDEFGIDSTADNTKDLIDVLNGFLLEKKAEGKTVILLIDEAQNLSKDVLEQLRLLSNLETNTSKLLQIILVGQPELGEMLDSHDLRQLGQRITLSCHLSPLSFRETREYILHRLRVAARKEEVQFTVPAVQIIYRYAGGIPRLINIACDRALLTAFGLNRKRVTAGIARSAVRELADRRAVKRNILAFGYPRWALAVGLGLVILVAGLLFFGRSNEPDGLQASTATTQQAPPSKEASVSPAKPDLEEPRTDEASASAPAEEPTPVAVPLKKASSASVREVTRHAASVEELDQELAGVDASASRQSALRSAMALWVEKPVLSPYLDTMEQDEDVFRFAARQNGLRIHRVHGGLLLLETLNVPAILPLMPPQAVAPRYVTLRRIRDGEVALQGVGSGDGTIWVAPDILTARWNGEAFVVWKDFLNFEGTIPTNATRESIVSLKMLLQDIGFKNIEITPYYDEAVKDAVEAVQKRNGVEVDGLVGPITKIVLYNEKSALGIPFIRPEGKVQD